MIVSAVEPTGVALFSVLWLKISLVKCLVLYLIICNAIWAIVPQSIIIIVYVMVNIIHVLIIINVLHFRWRKSISPIEINEQMIDKWTNK